MKKHILALLLSAAALVTFTASPMAQRWGWTELPGPTVWSGSNDAMVPLKELAAYVGSTASMPVSVVPVAIDPAALKSPGILAGTVPVLEEALAAIRVVVASNPLLATNLAARGLNADNVVGLTHSADGITLFVSNA